MSIESHLSCLAALPLVGLRPSRQGEELTCSCPSCGQVADIVQPSILCRSRSCAFGRGGALDLLAFSTRSYTEALRLAGTLIPGIREGELGEAHHFYNRRKLLEFFLNLESNSQRDDYERIQLRHQFRGTRVSSSAFPAGFLYATGAEAQTLHLLLLEFGVVPPAHLSNQPVMLIPYWGHPHVLSRLGVISQNFQKMEVVEVEKFRYSWFGLTHKHPYCDKLDVFPSYLDAMAAEERFKTGFPGRLPCHLTVDAACSEGGYLPEDLVFHGNENTWFEWLPLWSLMKNFENYRFYEAEHGYQNLTQLLQRLLVSAIRGKLPEFLDLCGACRFPVASRTALLLQAERVLDRAALLKLREVMSRRLLEKDHKGALYETSDGYELQSSGSAAKQLSNFTVTMHSVVAFPALSELNYQGTATVGPVTFAFDLPSKSFQSPTRLYEALQSKQITRPGAGNNETLAIVSKGLEFKRVLDWLRVETVSLPRSLGYRNLGWSRRHDLFITPLVSVDSAGVNEGVNYYPESPGDHHCYDSSLPRLLPPDGIPELHPVLAELVSGLVSQTVRYYHGLKVRPIPLRNTHKSRVLGRRLFQGFGQKDLFRVTSINPRNLELNRGMPCLISNLTELQAQQVTLAGLYLSETGPDLEPFSSAEIDLAASCLVFLTVEIARRLVSGAPVAYREKRSVKPLAALAVEGADLIRQDFWDTWPSAGFRWAATDTLLETHQEKLSEVMGVDEAKDEVVIKPRAWANGDQTDLVIELGMLCKKVSADKDAIRVDRSSFYLVLGDFYGDVPRLAACVG